ncbi:MAG TPA: hypothetical protein VG435_14645 [Acidimicrobiales bacterium]|nr:hypothetical protein [Acidimicrobiales bacterium]
MSRRAERWSSLGLGALIGLCWWQLLAAAIDAWHFQSDAVVPVSSVAPNYLAFSVTANFGRPSWIIASDLAGHVTYPLVAAGSMAMWLNHRFDAHDTTLRVAVWMLALCGSLFALIGGVALLDRHMAAAVAYIGPIPDTLRATSGEEFLIGLAVLAAASHVARRMQSAELAERRSVMTPPSSASPA